jgi:predicted SnoaL-like aldol condensation-catalyzing enzyme
MLKKNIFKIVLFTLGWIFIITACNCNHKEVNVIKAQLDSVSGQLDKMKAEQLKLESNKKLVAAMYQELFGDKNIDAADKYIAGNYIQHNPMAADGREALKNVLRMWFKNAPKEKIDIQRIGADGDFVYIHTRMKMGSKMASVIDIFRIEDSKIVEHWDVIQQVPEKSANEHPMF